MIVKIVQILMFLNAGLKFQASSLFEGGIPFFNICYSLTDFQFQCVNIFPANTFWI